MSSVHPEIFKYINESVNPACRKLLLGSVGGNHLLEAGLRSLDHDSNLAVELLSAAWCASPVDGRIAATLMSVDGLLALLPDDMAVCIKNVAEHWKRPENLSYFMRLAGRRDFDKIGSYLISNIEKDSGNFFWIQQGLIHAAFRGDYDFASAVLKPLKKSMPPVWNAMRSWFAFLEEDNDQALKLLIESGKSFGLFNFYSLAASVFLKLGEKEKAVSILGETVSAQPWRTSELLRLHDIVKGIDNRLPSVPENLVILLYSYNKAEELDATFRSLFKSDLGNARIIILDNGSTDSSSCVIDKWQDSFSSRLKRIDLPVNIGAAAARNWLMTTAEVKASEYVLYLDDDVEVPENWLHYFAAAVENYPDAGAWGCRVVDFSAPRIMQSVDLHLVQPEGSEGDGPEYNLGEISPNPFKVSDLHHQGLDSENFNFMRPCSSVTGCCHLFKTSRLLDNGGFSLFLSPSQYDDMEHDIRLCLQEEWPVYQGHLRILHRKNTGNASRLSAKQESNAIGNKYKMQAMHPRSEILKIMAGEEKILRDDLRTKLDFLCRQGVIA
jgi:hypothetical protein